MVICIYHFITRRTWPVFLQFLFLSLKWSHSREHIQHLWVTIHILSKDFIACFIRENWQLIHLVKCVRQTRITSKRLIFVSWLHIKLCFYICYQYHFYLGHLVKVVPVVAILPKVVPYKTLLLYMLPIPL